MGIDRSGVGGGESGDRQEWGGRGESGDRQEEWGGMRMRQEEEERRGSEMKGRGCLSVTMMVMEHGPSLF